MVASGSRQGHPWWGLLFGWALLGRYRVAWSSFARKALPGPATSTLLFLSVSHFPLSKFPRHSPPPRLPRSLFSPREITRNYRSHLGTSNNLVATSEQIKSCNAGPRVLVSCNERERETALFRKRATVPSRDRRSLTIVAVRTLTR